MAVIFRFLDGSALKKKFRLISAQIFGNLQSLKTSLILYQVS